MAEHFLSDLVGGSQEFKPEPWYNEFGDCITYQNADEAVVRERIDDLVTVYRSAIDNRPIGFQIKGVLAILKKFGLDALLVKSEEENQEIRTISVSALLLTAYESGPMNMSRREAYAQLLDRGGLNCAVPVGC